MNISSLAYFIEIVNCDFNLTKAAQKKSYFATRP
ncbi:LysR family transcriptional regulator [Streptococcus pyogenes]|nr:LysR family transcriptional regulator [Streptococcus pyogenes]VGT55449.1 LysR family transcriptional regulator [Streptococcus pyogenes]VGW35196.1 LysR family transcriptional regulator [Streptococcus pyogenes]VGX96979.1 LysR family transcriptional regulator [Streptococcus pyogenes]VHC49055.1 LysR family transcriptional regulator [Streptococcus pyogenes]